MHAVMVAMTRSNRRYSPYSSVDDSMADTSQKENVKSSSVECAHVQAAMPVTWTSVSIEAGSGLSKKAARCVIVHELMEQSLCQVGDYRAQPAPKTGKLRGGKRSSELRSPHDAFEAHQCRPAHHIRDGVLAQLVQENLLGAIECTLERTTAVQWTRAATAVGHCTNTFHRRDNITHAKRVGGNSELESAITTADGIDVTQFAQALCDLVHVMRGDVITLGDFCSADRFAISNSSEINQQAKRKVGVKGKAHLRSRVVKLTNSNLKTGLIFYPDG